MTSRSLLAYALLAFAVTGCGNSPPAGGAPDLAVAAPMGDLARPPDLAAASCSDDKSCGGATPKCDVKTGRCVACLTDGECPEGQLCREGACAAGCSAQKGCGDAGICEVDAGICKGGCNADADCGDPANPRCDLARHACVPCLIEMDNCPMGKLCVKTNDVYSCNSGCKGDNDCGGADAGENTAKCCNSVCIDVAIDGANCGACGNACGMGKACCASACVDTMADIANCGGCAKACKSPFATDVCNAGQCAIGACDKGFADCDKMLGNGCEVDTETDSQNCTTCGMVCAVANAVPGCSAGCTVAMCNAGFGDCDKMAGNGCEADLNSDAKNCASCGTACGAIANATIACAMGKCGIGVCNGTFKDCDKDPVNGCESDSAADGKNCGMCGTVCPNVANGVQGCAMGKCGIGSCNGGFADCDNNPANGCELPVAGDVKNCGGCAKVCATPPNGSPTCTNGVCNTQCACGVGFANCDNNCANGCEINQTNDAKNCGACAKACPVPANSTATCATSVCNATCACNFGFADCDKSCLNGCEINVTSDVKNCGGCGFPCGAVANGTPGCVLGQCTVGTCNGGFGDCDKLAPNGCEANLASEGKNCGACGTVCAVGRQCVQGKCLEFTSCAKLLAGNVNLASGLYTIDPDGVGADAPFSVYCDMKSDGGGWTLALKIDGAKTTFTYDAALWVNQALLNANLPNLDLSEAKLQSFNTMPYTALRVGMIDAGATRWLTVPTAATSLYAAMNAPYKATSVGRAAWKTLLASGSLQANCNKEGINTYGPFGNPWPRVRIGIVSNQENDCGSPDSWVGFGTYGAPCGGNANISCGNLVRCTGDNGDKDTATFGYVMLR